MINKGRKLLLILIILVIVILGGLFGYNKYISPTHVALVNFKSFVSSPIVISNTNSHVQYHVISTEEFCSSGKKYDFALFFGMGLKLDEEHRQYVEKYARDKHPMQVIAVTTPENDICNLDSIQQKQIETYFNYGNRHNYQSMANYIRKYIDKKSYGTVEPDSITESPSDVLYHLDESIGIDNVQEFNQYLKSIGYYHEGGPRVAILSTFTDPYSGNKEQIDSLITTLNRKGMNVYPIYSMMERMKYLSQIRPNAVIYMAHGRMAFGPMAERMIALLKKMECPVFAPLTLFSDRKAWEEDPMGMMGGYLSQSVVMPEIDGAIYPYALNLQEENSNGVTRTIADPLRLQKFTDIISNMIALQSMPNKDKKVAIYYYKGPGQEGLNAQGLEVVPSIYNVLKHLKEQGYTINLPESQEELAKLIMTHGPVLTSFAKGSVNDFIKDTNPISIETDTLNQWMQKYLSAYQIQELEKKYGSAPGSYMTYEKDGKSYISIPTVQLGNVIILPQLMSGIGDDTFAIVHGTDMAPPYPYIASYLWAREGFKADALMHFGTHGSLEFTPKKQIALSDNDWADAMVGTTPHFYYYTIANVGEGIIAKRRSYATLISYLNPPFEESQTRSSFSKLQKAIIEYDKADNAILKDKWALRIKENAMAIGIHRDLRLDTIPGKPYNEEDIHRIDDYAEEIANEKIYGTLYTTGVPFTEEQLNSTVMAMSSDPIGYAKASLDLAKGKLSLENYRRLTYLSRHYLDPAKSLVKRILAGYRMDSIAICEYAGITMQDLRQAEELSKPQATGMAAMMRAMQKRQEAAQKAESDKPAHPHHPDGMPPKNMEGNGDKPAHPHHPDGMPPKNMEGNGDMPAHPHHPGGMPPKNMEGNGDKPAHPHHSGGMPPKNMEGNGDKPAHPHHPGGIPPKNMVDKGDKPAHPHHPSGMPPQNMVSNGDKPAHPHHPGGMPPNGMKAMAANSGGHPDIATPKDRDKAVAIMQLFNTIMNVNKYKLDLKESANLELQGIDRALSGKYMEPSSAGDVIANPRAIPTGRNFYSINAEATPSEGAWEKAKLLVDNTLDHYIKKHGEYPKKVSYTFWSGSFIESSGTTFAQALYMLGVEPVRDMMGRVSDVRLIPSEVLGRPRIDILVQTSGQFRDLAASRLMLLTKAVDLAAAAGDQEQYPNFVHEGNINIEKSLVNNGISPKDARAVSNTRVFGGVNGMYGTGITGMIMAGDKWENQSEIAEVYLNNMGAMYGSVEDWGAMTKGLFRAAIENTDVIIQPRQSNTWGALSLDHVFEFMGGLNLTIKTVTGKEPEAMFADYRNHSNFRMQELKEAIGVESRSTILNPFFVKEVLQGGNSSGVRIQEIIENTYGWNVSRPEVIDKELWDGIYDLWIMDKENLGTREFFKKNNPAALEQITAVMLETARKGLWQASAEQVKSLAQLNHDIVNEFGASGGAFDTANPKLREFITKQLDPEQVKSYDQQMEKILNASKEKNDKGIVLKEETSKDLSGTQSASDKTTAMSYTKYIIGGFLLVLLIVLISLRRRGKSSKED